jgi:hypothetical protein
MHRQLEELRKEKAKLAQQSEELEREIKSHKAALEAP